eukprot:GHVU01196539.1.p1 GENE.GHVU01196539.1~~GHVU01196539.1.p1  ORF type:complete len:307 (+),score=22.14 GHVU01196539.1:206-1126(+)
MAGARQEIYLRGFFLLALVYVLFDGAQGQTVVGSWQASCAVMPSTPAGTCGVQPNRASQCGTEFANRCSAAIRNPTRLNQYCGRCARLIHIAPGGYQAEGCKGECPVLSFQAEVQINDDVQDQNWYDSHDMGLPAAIMQKLCPHRCYNANSQVNTCVDNPLHCTSSFSPGGDNEEKNCQQYFRSSPLKVIPVFFDCGKSYNATCPPCENVQCNHHQSPPARVQCASDQDCKSMCLRAKYEQCGQYIRDPPQLIKCMEASYHALAQYRCSLRDSEKKCSPSSASGVGPSWALSAGLVFLRMLSSPRS